MRFKNIFWNLIGLGFPLLVAAATVPKLLAQIGAERFGFIALAWGLIGYASALDLGIGRATTQKISALRGSGSEVAIPDVVATATRITAATGLAGLLAISAADLGGVTRLVHSITVLPAELNMALLLLAFALPMQAISATYKGVNEAYLNFKAINVLRLLLGVANFGAPFVVSLYTRQLPALVGTLVVSRLIALVFYRHYAYRCLRSEGHALHGTYKPAMAVDLLRFGGWYAVSSIISPFLGQADRFMVGALISASAITVYVLPYEVTVQTLLLVGAITTVAFPHLTNLVHVSPLEARRVFSRWLARVMVLMLFTTLTMAAILPMLLRYWIGPQISQASVQVGQILCIGVFFNAAGSMYYALLHAKGNTRATALLHLSELPFYAAALYFLIHAFGVQGAALAWSLRMAIDAVGMAVLSARQTPLPQA